MCASNFIAIVWTRFYSNMTVSLCIRQESKRNDDSVSVEELDWSAERQLNTSGVTLNADLEPKTHHQTPMTCTFIIWTKVLDTNFFRREKYTSKLATNTFLYLKIVFPSLLQQFWSVWNDCTHMNKSLVFGDEFLAQGLYLKSHQKCSAVFLQTSQVLPHWLNHHFSLILVLYTETLSC